MNSEHDGLTINKIKNEREVLQSVINKMLNDFSEKHGVNLEVEDTSENRYEIGKSRPDRTHSVSIKIEI